MPPQLVLPVLSTRQRVVLVVVLVVSVGATAALVFGPARGAREDIGQVRTDLHGSRVGIYDTLAVGRRTLDKLSEQLRTTKTSLEVQQQGLAVAQSSQQVAGATLDETRDIRRQTADTLATLRRVIAALGPLADLKGDIRSVVDGVEAGVVLARTTLTVARQTLRDGQRALEVAVTTLATLRESKQIQEALLRVGRRTLHQVVEINRKIPTPPVFPTGTPAPSPAG
ncbi:MAG: hypothetical protein JWP31_354 [Aeromicrobium sp.]|nr:hypothetical protein [Aeromicrobium sp.]